MKSYIVAGPVRGSEAYDKILHMQKKIIKISGNPDVLYDPHFTLKALGETSEEVRGKIACVLSGLRFTPFDVNINDFGFFRNDPSKEGSRNVVFLRPESSAVYGMHLLLCEIFSGYEQENYYSKFFENGNFQPHITINSKFSDDCFEKIANYLSKEIDISFTVDRLVMASSEKEKKTWSSIMEFPFVI